MHLGLSGDANVLQTWTSLPDKTQGQDSRPLLQCPRVPLEFNSSIAVISTTILGERATLVPKESSSRTGALQPNQPLQQPRGPTDMVRSQGPRHCLLPEGVPRQYLTPGGTWAHHHSNERLWK
mmetsp:Transcript_91990/g.159595  ORF Transcript_91990/g.159595 Transcript_91990/m.159595 type:complete len:123 (-) Transcript_91990:494-862(-)